MVRLRIALEVLTFRQIRFSFDNCIHKPPALPVRIEKVLPLRGDHCSNSEPCRWLMNGVYCLLYRGLSLAAGPTSKTVVYHIVEMINGFQINLNYKASKILPYIYNSITIFSQGCIVS